MDKKIPVDRVDLTGIFLFFGLFKTGIIAVEFCKLNLCRRFACRIVGSEIVVGGICKVEAAGLEGAACHIADIVHTAGADDIDHFFGFLIARIFALQGFFVEGRNDFTRADRTECFGDGTGALHIADGDRNDKQMRAAVGSQ